MWTGGSYAPTFELKFDNKEDNCFEDHPFQEITKNFQTVYAIQGKAEHPHHFKRLKSYHKDPAKRAKLHQYVHFEGEFKILYVIITSPDGPELGRQHRADVAQYEVDNCHNMKNPRAAVKNVIKHSERRYRICECLFWVPEMNPEYGPDSDLLQRRT